MLFIQLYFINIKRRKNIIESKTKTKICKNISSLGTYWLYDPCNHISRDGRRWRRWKKSALTFKWLIDKAKKTIAKKTLLYKILETYFEWSCFAYAVTCPLKRENIIGSWICMCSYKYKNWLKIYYLLPSF